MSLAFEFGVPMGSFFGAELCDLIGLYSLSNLKHLYYHNDIGLYRDDGLAILKEKTINNSCCSFIEYSQFAKLVPVCLYIYLIVLSRMCKLTLMFITQIYKQPTKIYLVYSLYIPNFNCLFRIKHFCFKIKFQCFTLTNNLNYNLSMDF